jgi:hypothetical protein
VIKNVEDSDVDGGVESGRRARLHEVEQSLFVAGLPVIGEANRTVPVEAAA